MNYQVAPILPDDGKPVIDIFNYYIENSFAAYPEKKVPYDFFNTFMQLFKGYPSLTVKDAGHTVGFGFIRAHHPAPVFSQTAEITYFILPEFTRMGIGKLMLDHLSNEAKQKNTSCLLANISSLNPASLAFHKKNGFTQCSRFLKIGKKNGELFDVIWMQKILS